MSASPPCLVAVLSELHPDEAINPVMESLSRTLQRAMIQYRGVARSPSQLSKLVHDCNGALVLVGSGGTEYTILRGLERYGGGVLLLSYDGNNSLAAMLEVLPALREAGVRVDPVHYPLGGKSRVLEDHIRALAAYTMISRARLGLIGGPAPWLVYSRMGPEAAAAIGVEVVEVPLSRVVEYYYEVPSLEAERLAFNYSARATGQVRGEGLVRATRIYLALKRIREEYNLQALTIRCFDIIPVLHATPCLALALLNSEGVVAGCEGDVPSTITMMMAHYASGQPAFMGNLSDVQGDTALVSHCTAPISIGSYTITTHYETGQPVGVSVTYPSGRPVTLARLHPRLHELVIARGTIVASRPRPRFCRTQIAVRLRSDASWIIEESTGNHYVVVLGDHTERLKGLARLLGVPAVLY